RRAYQASVNRIERRLIEIDKPWRPTETWLEVGDSANFRVGDSRCSYDVCFGTSAVLDSGWTVADTTVARVHPVSARPAGSNRLIIEQLPSVTLTGVRPGRTRLRVTGLNGPSDTIPVNRPPPRSLERDIIVAVPVDRVRLSPRPEVIRVDDTLIVTARA